MGLGNVFRRILGVLRLVNERIEPKAEQKEWKEWNIREDEKIERARQEEKLRQQNRPPGPQER